MNNEKNPISVVPWDSHNQRLVANVHPPDWTNPTPAPRYNLVVLGAGTAGLVTAAGAAGLGAKVALIEKGLMGGDCLNVGCVPSKALVRAARAVAAVREAAEFGVHVAPLAPPSSAAAGLSPLHLKCGELRADSRPLLQVDFAPVMERMRRLRADLSPQDSAKQLRELGADVFLGAGKFTGPDAIEVGGQTLRFAKAVIATGARAAVPPIAGLKDVPYLTRMSSHRRRLILFARFPLAGKVKTRNGFDPMASHSSLWDVTPARLEGWAIQSGLHCLACTAGCGSSCIGALRRPDHAEVPALGFCQSPPELCE